MSPAPEWLRRVLVDLERAMVLLVDVQLGRAALNIELAVQRSDELIDAALRTFRDRSSVLTPHAVKRATGVFAATYALRCRVAEQHGRADHELARLVGQAERPTN